MPIELYPENITAFRVYTFCKGQLILAGMDASPVDISIPAVETAMKWFKIPAKDRGKVGLKVVSLARHGIEKMREEREARRDSQ